MGEVWAANSRHAPALGEVLRGAASFFAVFSIYGLWTSGYIAAVGLYHGSNLILWVIFSAIIDGFFGALVGSAGALCCVQAGRVFSRSLKGSWTQHTFYVFAAVFSLVLLDTVVRMVAGFFRIEGVEPDIRALETPMVAAAGLVGALVLVMLYLLISCCRKPGLIASAALLVLLAPVLVTMRSYLGVVSPVSPKSAPTVILISIDTLRSDHVGVIGNPWIRTPAIDAIAKDGVVFRNAYAPAPSTWPSLASVLTGRFTLRHGVRTNGLPLPIEEVTLMELYQDAGFETVGISDIGFQWMGFHQGIQRFIKREAGLFETQPIRRSMPRLEAFSHWFANSGDDTTSLPQTMSAIRWIRETDFARPNVLWIHYYDDAPHLPYTSPAPFAGMYVPDGNHSTYGGGWDFIREIHAGKAAPTADDVEKIKALYAGEVTWCDVQIGAVIRQLKERGLYDEATVVLFSDHGQMFGHRGFFDHDQFVYEELLKVPLIIKPPLPFGHGKGTTVDHPVSLVDLFPTLSEIYGLHRPEVEIDGQSLVPFLRDGRSDEYRFWHYADTLNYLRFLRENGGGKPGQIVGFAVVTPEWKGISVPDLAEYHLSRRGEDEDQLTPDGLVVLRGLEQQALDKFGFDELPMLIHAGDRETEEDVSRKLEALGYAW